MFKAFKKTFDSTSARSHDQNVRKQATLATLVVTHSVLVEIGTKIWGANSINLFMVTMAMVIKPGRSQGSHKEPGGATT